MHMSLRARLRSLKKGLLQREDIERGLTDELRFHIESRAEALAARGLSLLDEFRSDLRYAVRILRKSPAFSLAAILTISIGIAANCSVFSLINEVLYRPLPVGHADELVQFDFLMVKNSMVTSLAGAGHRDPAS